MCLSTYLLITKTKYNLPFAISMFTSGFAPEFGSDGSSSSSFAEKNISTELVGIV